MAQNKKKNPYNETEKLQTSGYRRLRAGVHPLFPTSALCLEKREGMGIRKEVYDVVRPCKRQTYPKTMKAIAH